MSLSKKAAACVAVLAGLPAPLFSQDQDLSVVTDLPIIARLVSAVGGDTVSVRAILQGGDPHGAALRPSEAAALSDADLVVWTGPELNPSFARAVDRLSAATVLTLSDIDGTYLRAAGEDVHAHDDEHDDHGHDDHGHDDHGHDDHGHDDHGHDDHAEDEHGHEDHTEDHADGHDHGDSDPHTWLYPENAKLWLTALGNTLADRGDAGAAARAADAVVAIDEVSASLRTRFEATPPRFGVDHDALGYFSEAFGLTPVAALADSGANRPGPQRVAAATDALRDAGAVCLVFEAGHDSALADRVAEIADIPLVPVDLTGADVPDAAGYAEFLDAIGTALLENCVPDE